MTFHIWVAVSQDDVEEKYKERPYGKDGSAVSGWFVLDYGT